MHIWGGILFFYLKQLKVYDPKLFIYNIMFASCINLKPNMYSKYLVIKSTRKLPNWSKESDKKKPTTGLY